MKTSQISFTSTLWLTNEHNYKKAKELPFLKPGFDNEEALLVRKPIIGLKRRECVTNEFVGIRGVYTCTGLGIISQKTDKIKQCTAYHFDPDLKENLDLKSLRNYILGSLPDKPLISAIFFGKKSSLCERSGELFENTELIVKELGIPYSKFEEIPIDDGANGFYDGVLDRWTLWFTDRHKDLDKGFFSKKSVFKGFKKVIVSCRDVLV